MRDESRHRRVGFFFLPPSQKGGSKGGSFSAEQGSLTLPESDRTGVRGYGQQHKTTGGLRPSFPTAKLQVFYVGGSYESLS